MTSCPDAEMVRDLAKGVLPDDEKRKLFGHIAGCDRCRSLLEKVSGIGRPTAASASATRPSVLERARAGDGRDFAEIYACFTYGVARRSLPEGDAEDITQQVLLELWRMLPGFEYDRGRSFRGLVATIVRRRTIDLLRRRRAAALQRDVPADPDTLDCEVDDEREWQKALLRKAEEDVRGRVRPTVYVCFQQHGLDRRPAPEVAELLGLSERTVYRNCSLVTAMLRQRVDELREEEGANR